MKVGVLPLIQYDPPVDADNIWDRCDPWVFLEIFFSYTPEQQVAFDEDMSAKTCWDTLASQYQSASLGNIFHLTTEFNVLRQTPTQPASQYITLVTNAVSNLKCLGEDISNQKIKWQILTGVLPEFHTLVTTLSNIYTPKNLMSLPALKEAVLHEEQLLLQQKSLTPAPPPTLTQTSSASTPIAALPTLTGRRLCPTCSMGS